MLRLVNVYKVYPDGTIALRGVSLDIDRGEVHVLLGENGAGKTTLARIVYGEIKPTRGEVIFENRRVSFRGPWEAIRAGISMIYQHFSLVYRFTVEENLVLYGSRLGLSRREVLSRVEELAKEYGLKVPLDRRVDELPASIQQRVEIVKALLGQPKLLILDEPTSLISPLEAQGLYRLVKRLRDQGVSIIYITHRLREVKIVGDRVTVMRKGRIVATLDADKPSIDELAKLMVGEELRKLIEAPRSGSVGRVGEEYALRVERLVVEDSGRIVVNDVTLGVRRGEVLGIAGVAGNGQDELVEAIIGVRKLSRGRILLEGIDVTREPPWRRIQLGLAFLPGSRRLSLIQDMNLVENFALSLSIAGALRGLVIDWKSVKSILDKYIKELGIVAASMYTPVKYLSGGNQQKLALAKILACRPRVLVAVDPTHGLDIATTIHVRRIIRRLADEERVAVLLVSTDLEELLELSDRIAVMYAGRIVTVKPANEYTIEELGKLMGGGA